MERLSVKGVRGKASVNHSRSPKRFDVDQVSSQTPWVTCKGLLAF